MTGTLCSVQMRTASCTSSADCGNTTASGGWFSIQVSTLPCCSRTACEVTSRLPNFAASAAIAAFTALSLRGRAASSATAISCPANWRTLAGQRLNPQRRSAAGKEPAALPTSWQGSDRLRRLDLLRTCATDLRRDHANALAVASVLVAELVDQVTLLQHDAD